MEDHWLIVNDEVLTEVEPTGDGVDPQGRIDAVDARCNPSILVPVCEFVSMVGCLCPNLALP
jgi:hypothetical protein